jgi:hypothetical protein
VVAAVGDVDVPAGSTATPNGTLNWPSPLPLVPHVVTKVPSAVNPDAVVVGVGDVDVAAGVDRCPTGVEELVAGAVGPTRHERRRR